jgi:hypothetical protein
MAGWYQDADKYPLSSWVLGCLEREIDAHVKEERDRIIKLIEIAIVQNGKDSWLDAIELIKGEPK